MQSIPPTEDYAASKIKLTDSINLEASENTLLGKIKQTTMGCLISLSWWKQANHSSGKFGIELWDLGRLLHRCVHSQAVYIAACGLKSTFIHHLIMCYLLINIFAQRFPGLSLRENTPAGVLPCHPVATEPCFLRAFQSPLNHYSDVDIPLSLSKNKHLEICNCHTMVILTK